MKKKELIKISQESNFLTMLLTIVNKCKNQVFKRGILS